MKQSRRQELKTNALSVWLQETYAQLVRNSSYVIGGAVAIVVILIVVVVVQRNRQAAIDQAERTYIEIRSGSVVEKPDLIDQAGRLAEEQGPTTPLGAKAAELQGDLAYQLAMTAGPRKPADMISRLKQAKAAYEPLLSQKVNDPGDAARLRMKIAASEESLCVVGEGSADTVRKLYQAVIDGADLSFKTIALELTKSLDERLAKLKIVATQPASVPATAAARITASAPVTLPPITVTPAPTPTSKPAPVPGR
jgi:hypothetical protein